jgi:hypothetical protein
MHLLVGGALLAVLVAVFAARIVTLDPWGRSSVEKPRRIVPAAQTQVPSTATVPPATESASVSGPSSTEQPASSQPMPREILRFDAGDDPSAGNPAPPSPSDGQAWPLPQYAPSYRLPAQPCGGPPPRSGTVGPGGAGAPGHGRDG